MIKRLFIVMLLIFFLLSGLAFAKGDDSVRKKKIIEVTQVCYYSILGHGKFKLQSDNNEGGPFCLENCEIIETAFPVARQSVFLETGEIDSSGNLIYELGVFGFKSKEEAYEVLKEIGCCYEE